MTQEKKFVLPGDLIGTSEEFIPGRGVYEEKGSLFSSVVGELTIDEKEKIVAVESRNPPAMLKKGDIVLAEINGMRSSMATAMITEIEGNRRTLSEDGYATIRISNISEKYVEDIGREFRMGDMIRARVVDVSPSLHLSTVSKEFGVVMALCMRCKSPLVKKGNGLRCNNCERDEFRKLSSEYGISR